MQMSKVVITLDTVEDDLSVTVDGRTIDNISDVCIYRSDYGRKPYVSISISQVTPGEEDGDMSTYTRLTASEKDLKVAKEENRVVGQVGDLVQYEVDEAPVYSDIADMLSHYHNQRKTQGYSR